MDKPILIDGVRDEVVKKVTEHLNNGYELSGALQVTARNVGVNDTPQAKVIMPWFTQVMIKNTQTPSQKFNYIIVVGSDEEGNEIENNRLDYIRVGYQPIGKISDPIMINPGIIPNTKLIKYYAQAMLKISD